MLPTEAATSLFAGHKFDEFVLGNAGDEEHRLVALARDRVVEHARLQCFAVLHLGGAGLEDVQKRYLYVFV